MIRQRKRSSRKQQRLTRYFKTIKSAPNTIGSDTTDYEEAEVPVDKVLEA
jgi:hypothetical protein